MVVNVTAAEVGIMLYDSVLENFAHWFFSVVGLKLWKYVLINIEINLFDLSIKWQGVTILLVSVR